MTEQKTMSSVLICFWRVSSLWYSESPETYCQSCLLRYQEIHWDLVLIKPSGSILPCSLKSFNFITATGVPQGAVLDPLLFLYTKLLDEGSDLMASTTSMSMAHKCISLFPPSGHSPGSWEMLSLWTTVCHMPKYERRPGWESAFSQLRTQVFFKSSNSAEKAFLRTPTNQFTSCKQHKRIKKEQWLRWSWEREKPRYRNSTRTPLREHDMVETQQG